MFTEQEAKFEALKLTLNYYGGTDASKLYRKSNAAKEF